jgi:hypothetical protein
MAMDQRAETGLNKEGLNEMPIAFEPPSGSTHKNQTPPRGDRISLE